MNAVYNDNGGSMLIEKLIIFPLFCGPLIIMLVHNHASYVRSFLSYCLWAVWVHMKQFLVLHCVL